MVCVSPKRDERSFLMDRQHIDPAARMVVVEGLYSMDGDTLALADYSGEHWLAVDEAHSFGVLGPEGRGVAAAQGVEPDFLVGTLGKALGSYGAFVVGPPSLRELLISRNGPSFLRRDCRSPLFMLHWLPWTLRRMSVENG